MTTALYSVGTWDMEKQAYTPQDGLSVPSFNITLSQLRTALKELRKVGYSAHRRGKRDEDGDRPNDTWVLVERTDGECWKKIRRRWNR